MFVSIIVSHNGFDRSEPLNYFHFCSKHLLTNWIIHVIISAMYLLINLHQLYVVDVAKRAAVVLYGANNGVLWGQ